MEPSAFDEIAFFTAVSASNVRALVIGRRALVLLGLPVLTADPTHSPAEARGRGRYVLENDEHVDVLVARSLTTVDGRAVEFERLWQRRHAVRLDDVDIQLPSIEDLILTKQVASRPKDLEDIRLLRALKEPLA
ncbi:MAG: hypothetical protein DMF88_25100 [Acidobacteria bacterium]|nr:MAG: hypothetical protein DMF88_25100 [Acidobacteriota bacterium]